MYSRREFGTMMLAGLPASMALARINSERNSQLNSKFRGVQIGAITYSFRSCRPTRSVTNQTTEKEMHKDKITRRKFVAETTGASPGAMVVVDANQYLQREYRKGWSL